VMTDRECPVCDEEYVRREKITMQDGSRETREHVSCCLEAAKPVTGGNTRLHLYYH